MSAGKLEDLLLRILGGGFRGARHHMHAVTAECHHRVTADLGVAIDHVDISEFDTQDLRGDHGLGRVARLAHAANPGRESHRAISVYFDCDAVEAEECQAADVRGDTHTHAANLIALTGRGFAPALPFLFPADHLRALLDAFGQSRATEPNFGLLVEQQLGKDDFLGGMADIAGPPVILKAELDGVHANLLGGHVDGLLDRVRKREVADPAHAPGRQEICRHADEFGATVRGRVYVGTGLIGIELGAICTVVHQMTVRLRHHRAILLDADFGIDQGPLAALDRGLYFVPRQNQTDRPAGLPGQRDGQQHEIVSPPETEGAAGRRAIDADLAGR